MSEKVIFEFRVKENEGGCSIDFRHGGRHFTVPGPNFSAWCQESDSASVLHHGAPMWSHRKTDKAQNHMRETLDFLEQLYSDLFGDEDSTEIGGQ